MLAESDYTHSSIAMLLIWLMKPNVFELKFVFYAQMHVCKNVCAHVCVCVFVFVHVCLFVGACVFCPERANS